MLTIWYTVMQALKMKMYAYNLFHPNNADIVFKWLPRNCWSNWIIVRADIVNRDISYFIQSELVHICFISKRMIIYFGSMDFIDDYSFFFLNWVNFALNGI
jgi:hypothetical protein